MAEYLLINNTISVIEVADIGLVVEPGQEIPIDENDFDGYLTADLVAALGSTPSTGLVLQTPTGVDLPKNVAIERLTLGTKWKQSVSAYTNLPSIGNEDGDIRLVRDENVLYRWSQSDLQWDQVTSTFSLTVEDLDGIQSGSDINKIVFISEEDNVYIDGVIAYIGAPAPPLGLNGASLTISGATLYSGGLSQSNINYKAGDIAGAIVNYITNDGTFTLTTPNTNRANHGEKGTLSIWFNGNKIATTDLAANFNTANETSSQNISQYNTQGIGDPISAGIVNFIGPFAGKGHLQILSVQAQQGFKFYQVVQARAVITDASMLRQGWSYFYMTHDGLASFGGNQTSNTFDVFLDTDVGSNPSVSAPLVTEKTPSFNWLSGVKSYGSGSIFDVDVTGYDCFDNVYHSTGQPIQLYGWPGMSTVSVGYLDPTVVGVSSPPNINESMGIIDWQLTQTANVGSQNAAITAVARDPYGTYTPVSSSSSGIMIWSWGSMSTELIEYFNDENYRLLDDSYNTIPLSITGQWNSQQSLVSYDGGNGLQVFQGELYFPTQDFSIKLPTSNPNYTSLASETNKIYIRAFRDTAYSHANGTLRLTGITKTQLYNRDIRVFIKAPSITGWLDLTRDFNFPTFSGVDNDGCWVNRDSQTNSDFQFSLGQNYTELSGYMIVVKVLYPNSSAPKITHMQITDW